MRSKGLSEEAALGRGCPARIWARKFQVERPIRTKSRDRSQIGQTRRPGWLKGVEGPMAAGEVGEVGSSQNVED